MKDNKQLCEGLNESAQVIHQIAKDKGFYDRERNTGETLMLVVSELSEALEADRKGYRAETDLYDRGIFNGAPFESTFKAFIKDTFEDEIADAVIRLMDMSAYMNIDLEKHINLKVHFNKGREQLHGKLY